MCSIAFAIRKTSVRVDPESLPNHVFKCFVVDLVLIKRMTLETHALDFAAILGTLPAQLPVFPSLDEISVNRTPELPPMSSKG
jgi:hypothetical protein